MTENTTPEPQADPELDDLGLSFEEWQDLQLAYNFGLIEPAEGTVEAAAFDRMDQFARQEVERVWEAEKRDAEYARQHPVAREAHHHAEPEAGQ
jgi:hypothetical protein